MTVVSVCEYETIAIGERCSERVITLKQRNLLERASETYRKRYGVQILGYGPRGSLVAQNYVGVISMGRDQLEILPKIDAGAREVRRNLVKMLAVVRDVAVVGETPTSAHSTDSMLEVIVAMYCKQLWHALHKGLMRGYESRSENLQVLRGRISVQKQFRQNLVRPDRFACEFDEFVDDTHANRLLKASLRVLVSVVQRPDNARSIAELLLCFEAVEDVAASCFKGREVTVNRLSVHYKPLLSLARMFVDGQSPDVFAGRSDGYALMFDMNMLFEEYVGRVLQSVYRTHRLTVSRQGPRRHLATRTSGKAAFELRPDVVACSNEGVQWIVDTKWKRLDAERSRDGVSSADMYQMAIYTRQYDAKHVVLLYPHFAGLDNKEPGLRESYLLEGIESHRVSVGTLDLCDLRTVPQQLRSLHLS